MKKLAIFLAIMLIPFSAFALDTISDSDLDSVTGQAGVSIFTSSIQIAKTGVTTTYTDSNGTGNTVLPGNGQSASFSVVADSTVTQIYFLGFDPLNIDVVDTADVIQIVETASGATFNSTDVLGESAVQITLPNAIRIVNLGSTKTYYASDAAGTATPSNEMIQITTTGGQTVISLAGIDGITGGNHWANTADGLLSAVGVKHADQIKVLITSHE
jgi:hypothetical protein